MNNTGIMLVLAYPETIVRVADEWYSPFLRFIGIGKKNYVRAGHAGIVLIKTTTGVLEYHDFGRYIIPKPHGRVRNKITDHELDLPMVAEIVEGEITRGERAKQLASLVIITGTPNRFSKSACNGLSLRITELQFFINWVRGSRVPGVPMPTLAGERPTSRAIISTIC